MICVFWKYFLITMWKGIVLYKLSAMNCRKKDAKAALYLCCAMNTGKDVWLSSVKWLRKDVLLTFSDLTIVQDVHLRCNMCNNPVHSKGYSIWKVGGGGCLVCQKKAVGWSEKVSEKKKEKSPRVVRKADARHPLPTFQME